QENGIAVGPCVDIRDVVDKGRPATLEISKLPADELGHAVSPTCFRQARTRGLPCPTTSDSAGFPSATRCDKSSSASQPDPCGGRVPRRIISKGERLSASANRAAV